MKIKLLVFADEDVSKVRLSKDAIETLKKQPEQWLMVQDDSGKLHVAIMTVHATLSLKTR